jgi:hypothetical protein
VNRPGAYAETCLAIWLWQALAGLVDREPELQALLDRPAASGDPVPAPWPPCDNLAVGALRLPGSANIAAALRHNRRDPTRPLTLGIPSS